LDKPYIMKLVSWNVNGLRAVHKREEFLPFLSAIKPNILCLQETKAHPDQLPKELTEIPGYYAYFASSEVKKGYSGVALYTKREPKRINTKLGISKFDEEGRMIEVEYDDFMLFTVYFPNGGQGSHRIEYKLEFYDAFLSYIEKLRKKGKNIIFCGDVNTAHEAIDLARPKENEKNTGFLPEERAWLDELAAQGYIDTYRHFNPEKTGAYTYWDMKTFARDRNVGWRIDYFFTHATYMKNVKKADILANIYGSDHCPVTLELI